LSPEFVTVHSKRYEPPYVS